MTHTPHELAAEFPQDAQLIQRLKQDDAHFATLADRHHKLNRDIHRIETGIEPSSDAVLETLKKQRLAMLDEVASLLEASKNPSLRTV